MTLSTERKERLANKANFYAQALPQRECIDRHDGERLYFITRLIMELTAQKQEIERHGRA